MKLFSSTVVGEEKEEGEAWYRLAPLDYYYLFIRGRGRGGGGGQENRLFSSLEKRRNALRRKRKVGITVVRTYQYFYGYEENGV